MRVFLVAVAAVLFGGAPLSGQTLREFLAEYRIPTSSVPSTALGQKVLPGTIAQSPRWLVVSWSLPGAAMRTWPLHLIRMNRQTGVAQAGELRLNGSDACAGSLVGITLVDDFVLVETHVNPSAECVLVLDPSLRLRLTLHGFEPRAVEPGRIVLIESMLRSAAVHPERLQWVDLASGKMSELYPPKDDPFRTQIMERSQARMPAREVCAQNNDPCDPKLFDETLGPFATDGHGRFAMVVDQESDHGTSGGQDQTIAKQSALYLFEHRDAGWFWCESQLSEADLNQFTGPGSHFAFDQVADRCQPRQLVVPDMPAAATNPFAQPKKD